MTQINPCIKWTFFVFNVLFAFFGAILLLLPLLGQVFTHVNNEDLGERSTSFILLYVVGGATLIISALGAYGAHRENKVCLIIFLVCMVIGSLLMLRAGVTAAIARPQLTGLLEDNLRSVLPLDQSTEEVKNLADQLQTQLHCCGLFSYKDWRNDIPNSCLCSSEEEGECQTVGYSSFYSELPKKSIYSKTCFPIMAKFILLIADIAIAIVFCLAVLALLGMILSSIMIHQLRYPNRPALLVVPSVFCTPPPKYQELHNAPHC